MTYIIWIWKQERGVDALKLLVFNLKAEAGILYQLQVIHFSSFMGV
jgi:hypothetical protein